jgi:diguanylate cyclase (GGDEF)-like protein/PAS domain S-box-containing protein
VNPDVKNVFPFRPTRGKHSVLIVDDDPTTRKILSRMLDSAGYDITNASDGKEALSKLESNQFSLVLLDIVMPETDGLKTLEVIRKSYTVSDLPVVMITIKDSRDDITRALAMGANDYVIKPIDFPVLRARIDNLLSHKQLEDELRRAHDELEKRVEERTSSLVNTNEALEQEVQIRSEIENRLRENTEYFESLISYAQDIIAVFETDGTVHYESPAITRVLGYEVEERIGKNTFDLVHPEDREIVAEKFAEAFASPGKVITETARFKHKNGSWRVLESIGRCIVFRGKLRGIVNARDVTDRSVLTEQLSYHSSHDVLTGLMNRTEFKRLVEYIRDINLTEARESALLYLDLDRFKAVNETCGNVAGDELLKQFSKLLVDFTSKFDILARLGGNEFGIILKDYDLESAKENAKRLLDAINKFRFTWNDHVFPVSVSIGLVAVNGSTEDSHLLLEMAETACHTAKESGRDQIHVYKKEDEIITQRHGELLWVSSINKALDKNKFCLYMQPIVPLDPNHSDKDKYHYEVLLRMNDVDEKVIPPNMFLAVAERYNLSTRLDRWVINTAFNWLIKNPKHLEKLSICSINLSGLSLGNEAILAYIIDLFERIEIPPEKICFEITETAAIANLANATHFINALRKIGCRFALDDFGSGVSSFGYLKNLPIDYLKIDGMFIKEIENDNVNLAMVKSINDVGKAMGKLTIAEFVESENILEKLREIGIDFGQGYHIGKPIDINTLN